jgi:hypothetical protein
MNRRLPLTALLLLTFAGACADTADDMDAETGATTAEPMDAEGGDTMAGDGMAGAEGAMLSPMDATRAELMAVAPLDSAAVEALMTNRPYANMLEVDSVLMPMLDEAQREDVYRTVWMPLDLNEATPEEILLIPDVGDRMMGEFLEYRPYRAMEQFRREMGKYVDEDEVERLASYVELRGN